MCYRVRLSALLPAPNLHELDSLSTTLYSCGGGSQLQVCHALVIAQVHLESVIVITTPTSYAGQVTLLGLLPPESSPRSQTVFCSDLAPLLLHCVLQLVYASGTSQ